MSDDEHKTDGSDLNELGESPGITRKDIDALLKSTPVKVIIYIFLIVVGLFFLAFYVLIVVVLGWPFILAGLWPRINTALSYVWVRILFVVASGLLAGALYLIRGRYPRLYGIAEILIGIAMCWGALNNAQPGGLAFSLALAGGVYAIVQGIENVHKKRLTSRSS